MIMGLTIDDKASAILKSDEGFRSYAYDDATGKPIGPGTVVRGNPTVGYGVSLNTGGITEDEASMLLGNRIGKLRYALSGSPWFTGLDIVRQHAIICMGYQLGAAGVRSFTGMTAALTGHDYERAAIAVLASLWATQTPARAQRVAAMLRTGQYAVA